jgi:translocation and assembly module TamB
MRRALAAVLLAVAALLLLAAGAGAWVLYTEPGTRWSLARATDATHGALAIDGAAGTWIEGLRARRIRYASPGVAITATRVKIVLSPWSSLLALAPHIDTLGAAELDVVMTPGPPQPPSAPASLALPIDVDIAAARVDRLVVERNGQQHVFSDVSASYAGGRRRHVVSAFAATHALGRVHGRASLSARSPFPVDARIDVELAQPQPARVQATLGGTLLELRADASVHHAAGSAVVDARLAPFGAAPLVALHARWSDVDLRGFDARLPQTRISGELAVTAKDGGWAGPIHATNALAGPWDRQRLPVAALSALLAAQPEAAQLQGLRIDFGRAGVATGRAAVAKTGATLELATKALDLRSLASKLRQTHLAGHATFTLAGDRQRVSAVLSQDDARLALEGERTGDEVRVTRFTAASRGSELAGTARLSLARNRPYTVNAGLRAFDPAAWGEFPQGSLNGRIEIAGALAAEEIRVQYALDRSRLLGAALSGAGRFAYSRERVSNVDLRLALGGNSVRARGAFGNPGDALALRVDARELAVLDPRVSGTVRGQAQLSGTWRAPRGRIDLAVARFAYGKLARIAAATLRGTLAAGEPPSFDVSVQARGVTTAGWSANRIDLAAHGTPGAHDVTAHARGEDVDLALAARGGWDAKTGWSGVVSQLRNAGRVTFALEAPVDVTAAPGRLHLGPFAAQLMDGRLEVRSLEYENGVLDSVGRLDRFPVRAVIALAGLPVNAADTLRVSGHWAISRAPRMRMDFAFQRESGDLVLGADHPLPLGLTALDAQGHLVNDSLRFDARIASALVSASASGTVGTVGATGAAPRFGAQSALDVNATVDAARLAAFAGLFEATTVYFDGRAHARLSARGTRGEPILGGTIDGDALAVALPPQGIDLSGGTLRARLEGRRIAVDELTMHGGAGTLTARGTLALAADDRASLDWRADRLRVLGRPDRRLVVTGSGNASLERGRLALTGHVRADEGLFQIGESALPTLGPDVVIVGRPEPRRRESDLTSRAALDLALDFGNDLHILGQGLDAWIEGRVALRTGAAGALLASGTVRTQRGTYTAFGQKLQIDRGALIFDGPLDNPGLDIVAMRQNQAVQAGVGVTGSAKSPIVRIVSDPPVPEGEALSWLVLGHGPADASRADLAALPLAAAALFGQGNASKGSLAQSLGIDTLSLKGSTTLANNVIAVGKRVSRNLYVIYEQSLGGVANVLKIELNLTRRILLRAEAGATSTAGLVFRWAFD